VNIPLSDHGASNCAPRKLPMIQETVNVDPFGKENLGWMHG